MCNGSIMDKLISFSLPLMLSGILQLMFNAVDIIVVGRFSGKQALAAVGSTTALINVFTNLFIGISLGANVLAARFYAMGKSKEMSETVHTSITLAMVSGVIMAFVGVLFARGALELMGTPDDVIDQSTLYMRIYFMGMPFFMLYNYGAAILRAIGDTKRPLLFLIISGLINAALNMLLVIYCHMAVEGVAIATVISQLISCILVLWCLYKSEGSYQLRFSKLQIKGVYLKQIFQVGIPAGIQSMIINFSNVLLQSSVNSFGSTAMAGYGDVEYQPAEKKDDLVSDNFSEYDNLVGLSTDTKKEALRTSVLLVHQHAVLTPQSLSGHVSRPPAGALYDPAVARQRQHRLPN